MNAPTKRRPRQVQFLYMLFLIGYLALTALVMEQNHVIQNQKVLIRSLYQDSAQLTAMKVKAVADQYHRDHPDSNK